MKKVRVILLLLFLLALAVAGWTWRTYRTAMGDHTDFKEETRVLLLPHGTGMSALLDSLAANRIVKDTAAFARWSKVRKFRTVRPGRYVVHKGTSLEELVVKLRSGEQSPVRVTFTNIRTIPQLAGRVARYLEPDSLAMLAALQDRELMQRYGLVPETFITLFVPNTYEFWWTTTPQEFVRRMEKEHASFWTDERKAKAATLGLSPVEVSTLASIVQAETVKSEDAPRIAGVYLNRLRIGMPLQADPTLKFALGIDSVSRVLNVDKQVVSPYNTYRNAGLPPGPINMPEPRYIDAVLDPAQHKFLYFCARADLSGYSDFARTYEQHLVNARRYQRALDQRKTFR